MNPRNVRVFAPILFGYVLLLVATSCQKKDRLDAPDAQLSPEARAKLALIDQGRAAYSGMCIQCHHVNPSLAGAIGPAVAQSDRAVLESKLLLGKYPDGVKPRGKTNGAMPALPQYKDRLDALHAYLQTFPYTPAP